MADGEGRNGVFLAGLGHHVTSFDISSVGTEKALSLAARHGVAIEARVCAADAWDWAPASYDAVVAIFIQFASPALRKLIFDGIRRTLKPGAS
ncbi:MAG: class I SAM-dependent methyltransferase [Burkholderiaceae bacterium]